MLRVGRVLLAMRAGVRRMVSMLTMLVVMKRTTMETKMQRMVLRMVKVSWIDSKRMFHA